MSWTTKFITSGSRLATCPSLRAHRAPLMFRGVSSTPVDQQQAQGPTAPAEANAKAAFSIRAASWSLRELRLLREDRTDKDKPALSRDELKRLATYAHLDLERGPVQQDALQKDLDAIIGCMRILQSADLPSGPGALEATPGSPRSAPLREDVVVEGGDANTVLANAGEVMRQHLVAPKTAA